MKLIRAHLWPKRARIVADTHNNEYHSGVPTAHIDVDDSDDGLKLPKYKVWCPACHDDNKVIVMSSAGFLYGTISSVTRDITIVDTTHRRRWDTIIRRWKKRRYLTPWEKVDPPRKMLAVNGRVVNIEPPEGI